MNGLLPSQSGLHELKKRLLFVLFAVIIFRLGVHTPLPGVDLAMVADIFKNSRANLLLG